MKWFGSGGSSVSVPGLVTDLRAVVGARLSDPLMRSGDSLMVNVVLTAVLGFAFWIVAARLFSSQEVGQGSALVSAMIFISVVCQLNLGSVILRFLPITKLDPRAVIAGSYACSAVFSVLGGIAFVWLAPLLSSEYSFLARETLVSVLLVAATAAWAVFALQDAVLTALRSAVWVPVENGIFGVIKIVVLPFLLAAGIAAPVFVAWIIPMVALVVPVNYLIFARFIPQRTVVHEELSPVERFGWRGLASFMTQDYLASIFIQGSTTLVPVVVVAMLGGSEGAFFYIPFTVVGAFDLLFVKVASSFTVEAAMNSAQTAALLRRTVGGFWYFLLGGVVVLVAGASLILLPFGSDYVSSGATVLRLLGCASLFRALVALYCAVCRVEGQASRVLWVQAATFVLTIALTIVFAERWGLDGVGIAWLAANAVVAAAVVPRMYRLLWPGTQLAE